MGVFRVEVKVRNPQNCYLPPDTQGEEIEYAARVDSSAAELTLPVEVIENSGLEAFGVCEQPVG